MSDFPIIESVKERDVDLLVLEELYVSPEFRARFLKASGVPEADECELVSAWHSISQPTLGESDIVVIVEDPAGQRQAVLVENKISATPQDDQGARYGLRGEGGIDKNDWTRFTTCIIAPQRYLEGVDDASRYDFQISYETLREWLLEVAPGDSRAEYKAARLTDAIEHNRRGYSPVPDVDVMKFRQHYYDLVMSEFPELNMRQPGVHGKRAGWIRFHPEDLPAGLILRHKLRHGRVDLEIKGLGDRADEIEEANREFLDDDMMVIRASKSAAISISVPVISIDNDPVGWTPEIRKGIVSALRLWKTAARVLFGESAAQKKRRTKSRKNKKGDTVVLAGVVERAITLKAWYRGWEHRARLLKDGRISYDGIRYESPTDAARAAGKQRVSGWAFWHYRNSQGDWVPIRNLRK